MNEFGLILLMALVTYATRVFGFLAVDWLGSSPSIIRWSDRLANLVLAFILAKILVAAPLAIWIGVAGAAMLMIFTSRFLLSMWLGVAMVAVGRAIT
jgi:uncharacterized membrane protein